MIASNEYPRLRNFIVYAFHPECDKPSGTCRQVVDGAVAREEAAALQRVASESAALVASRATDNQIARWLELIGCYANLAREGHTPRSFVALIGDRIRARS